jgi:uncharacterized membrane protein YkvA (DUF1232 family)
LTVTDDSPAESPDDYSYFAEARTKAKEMLDDPTALKQLARSAVESGAIRSPAFDAVLDDFRSLVRLVVAYARDNYRQVPDEQMALVVAALHYVAMPIDLLPDTLPGGFLDDAYVVGWVIKAARTEIDAFRAWEEGRA